jgi:hypothetical protein
MTLRMARAQAAITERVRQHMPLLRGFSRNRPVPFLFWSLLRSALEQVGPAEDPLFPPDGSLKASGDSLNVTELRSLLSSDVLGLWALDKPTIELLWEWLIVRKPQMIVECGSGTSTLLFARYLMTRSDQIPAPSIMSVEQDADYKLEVEGRLSGLGMSDQVRIFHAPVSIDGRYQLDTSQVLREMRSRKADVMVIDGPSGPPGCRLWTLPLLAPLGRPGARWFLDDALRDGELTILNIWSRVPGIVVDGIYPIGKGLATGVIADPRSVSVESVSHAAVERGGRPTWSRGSAAAIGQSMSMQQFRPGHG